MNLLYILLILKLHFSHESNALSKSGALKFLETFGYVNTILSPGKEHDNSLIFDHRFRIGLKKFQRMHHLKQSGLLDTNTERLMLSPRCGNKDILNPLVIHVTNKSRYKRFSADRKYRWNKKYLTFKVASFPNSGLSNRKVRSIFQRAFNKWARVTNIDFKELEDYSKEADIIIEFGKRRHGDSIPFDGPGYVLAHAYLPDPLEINTFSFSGDAHFDDDEHWTDGYFNGKNLFTTAIHELGHSLGMGHSLVKSAIMYPYYVAPTSGNIVLHTDDIKGIQSLYGLPPRGKYIPPIRELPIELPSPPSTPVAHTSPPKGPAMCNTNVDVIVLVRESDLFIFKDEWHWRVKWSKTINNWYSYKNVLDPSPYSYFWSVIPSNLGGLDAALEVGVNQMIYIFRGRRFWILASNSQFERGFTKEGRPLTELGLPANLNKIDTMFSWGYNKAIYIFAGNLYWKFDENTGDHGRVISNPRYPRVIQKVWLGLPSSIDAAYTGLDGDTYFFKGKNYYSFNNYQMRVRSEFPKPAKLSWLGCSEKDNKEN